MERDEDWVDPADKIDACQKKYQSSDKGREARDRYRQSEQGKQAQERYLHSNKGKTAHEKYRNSDKGRESQIRAKNAKEEIDKKLEELRDLVNYRKDNGLCIYCGKDDQEKCQEQESDVLDVQQAQCS